MRVFTSSAWMLSFVLFATSSGSALAALSEDEAYLQGYAEMGKQSAAWAASQSTLAKARSSTITAWGNAQAALINAQAKMVTSVATAQATNAKTLQTLQQTRSLALDNDLKVAKTFYEKRKLHDGYRALKTRKRPGRDDLIRYSRDSGPARPSGYQLDPVRGKIIWPEVFKRDDFLEARTLMSSLFENRNVTNSGLGSQNCREIRSVAQQMREQLRSVVREMPPAEYMAARKFIDGLAFEAKFRHQSAEVASSRLMLRNVE